MEVPQGVYKAMTQISECLRCKATRDIRCGVCFDCSARISAERVPGGHRLWDRDNPANYWFVSEAAH